MCISMSTLREAVSMEVYFGPKTVHRMPAVRLALHLTPTFYLAGGEPTRWLHIAILCWVLPGYVCVPGTRLACPQAWLQTRAVVTLIQAGWSGCLIKMLPGRFPLEMYLAWHTGQSPQGRLRTRCRDDTLQLAWKWLGISQEELQIWNWGQKSLDWLSQLMATSKVEWKWKSLA